MLLLYIVTSMFFCDAASDLFSRGPKVYVQQDAECTYLQS